MADEGIAAHGIMEIRIRKDADATFSASADFRLTMPGAEAYIVGRSDNTSSYQPDIDLFEFGGQQKGVSRRHAVLMRYRGRVHLMDLESVNGTFINGQRLVPNVPYPVGAEDQLSLANMEINISGKAD